MTRLAPLVLAALLVVGCEASPSYRQECRDSIELLGSEHRYSTCDVGAAIELHGDFAICRCPRGAVDGGAK